MSATRRALVISPSFFGYERAISEEIRTLGYDVVFLDERPSNSAFSRALIRARPVLLRRRTKRYYLEWSMRLADTALDIVVVIKAEVVPRWFLEQLRAANTNARFIFYTFDSISNSHQCLQVVDLFDRRLTFDRDDAATRRSFEYLPLFYSPEFAVARSHLSRRWTVCFVGTLHSSRYGFMRKIGDVLPPTYSFFFMQARWHFAVTKYITRQFSRVPWSDVKFVAMCRADVAAAFGASRAVLDIQRDGQVGLTMRTFEALAAGAVLLTTNDSIRYEEFYDVARIIILPKDLDRVEAHLVHDELLRRPVPTGMPPGFERYSLSSWVRQIIQPDSAVDGQRL